MSDSTEAVQEPARPAGADGPEPAPKKRKRSRRGGGSKAEPGADAGEDQSGESQGQREDGAPVEEQAKGQAAGEPASEEPVTENSTPGEGPAADEEQPSASDGAAPEGDAAPEAKESGDADGADDAEEDAPTDQDLVLHASALLFASPEPVPLARLAKLLGVPQKRVKAAMAEIEQRLSASGLGFELRGLAGGSTFMTPPALGDVVAGLSKHAAVERISPAALETLAVIAYRQPVTKAEIEAIRGVQAGPVLRSLVDRGLVRVLGRSEEPGHALQYGTSKEFLTRFGLESLDDLPRDGELARD